MPKVNLREVAERFAEESRRQQEQDPPAIPKQPRFEVEDERDRKNYCFVIDEVANTVTMHNTSRGSGNPVMQVFGPSDFPAAQPDARSYYNFLFDKSLKFGFGTIAFIGYVDENFQPFDDDESS